MVLKPGDAVGPYLVLAAAGAGGMGEVYKARDTRLNRIVALKVVGDDDGRRSELTERFAIEAKAIAALSHSHICAIYDVGHYAGRNYLVLEYLEGEVLADRLHRGALTTTEVLRYATEMADALDFAHLHGIVHRDLKPSNVFLCRGAGVKLLDFGLAKMRAAASTTDGASSLATEPMEITTESAIVGTLPYMAPERLEGREADARADIFSYGAILYEMIGGRKAFAENTQARLIASILTADPPRLELTSDKPNALEWIVRHCLAKDPDERWQSTGDVSKVLKNLPQSAPTSTSSAAPRAWRRKLMAVVLLVAAFTAVAAWLLRDSWRTLDVVASPVVLEFRPPAGLAFAMTESSVQNAQFAISPDGQTIAVVARAGADEQLWIKELGRQEPRPLPGTAGASYPFWSPDSRSIGFFASGALKIIRLTGRSPMTVCAAPNGRGGAWQEDGTIVFSPDNVSGLHKISANSNRSQPLTTLGDGHIAHRWPQFLPGGNVLFFVRSADSKTQGIYATTLAAPHGIRQVRSNSSSGVFSSGRLLYVLEGTLVAQAFDARTWTLSGDATPIDVSVSESSGLNPAVSASRNGVLVTWSNVARSQLTWYDRQGNQVGVVGPPDRHVDFRLSPDDQRLAVSRVGPATNSPDVGVIDLRREGSVTLISTSSQTDASPIWSPDGRRLVFRSNRRRLHNLFERPSDGGGEDRLLHPADGVYPTDWSADGWIVFHQRGQMTQHDIWKLDPVRLHAEPLQSSPADEIQGQLAVGGRLAYVSDETRTMNVFVRALNGTTGPVNVSINGGFDPRWRADGQELFYVSPNGMLMSAELASEGPPRVIQTKPLFKTSIPHPPAPFLSTYVANRDGTRFLINEPLEPPGSIPITVTLNWPALLLAAR